MITREQIADLRVGDVVELCDEDWQGSIIRGPLVEREDGTLTLGVTNRTADWEGSDYGRYVVRRRNGSPSRWATYRSLTVISRVARPYYVNHDREEPAVGDVVRSATRSGQLTLCWIYCGDRSEYGWHETSSDTYWGPDLPSSWPSLHLLVDGETGRVVH